VKRKLLPSAVKWLAALIVVGAVVWFSVLRLNRLAEQRRPPAAEQTPQAVLTKAVRSGPIARWVAAQGTVRAVNREYLYFRDAGTVTFVKPGPEGRELREGDIVEEGEVLAQIDPREFEEEIKVQQALLDAAQARHKAARADLERFTRLLEQKLLPPAEYDKAVTAAASAEADIRTAEARLEQARVALERTRLIAPRSGMIAYLNVRKGYYFDPHMLQADDESQLLSRIPMVLIDPSEYEATIELPSYEAAGLHPGCKALLGLNDDLANLSINREPGGDLASILRTQAEVFSVNPVVDPGRRSVQVRIRTRQQTPGLKDGAFVVCWIMAESKHEATLAPYRALLYSEGRPYCFVVETVPVERRELRSVARKRALKLGIQGASEVEVSAGLKPGDRLVLEGQHILVDGAPVTCALVPEEG